MSVLAYGRPAGLAARLAEWNNRLRRSGAGVPAIGDVPAGSFWGGLIADIGAVMQILNLREFGEWLRVNGPAEHRQFADEIMANDETLEAFEAATYAARDRHELGDYADPVAAVEALDKRAQDYEAVRRALVDTGALAEGDDETPVADLIRALLA